MSVLLPAPFSPQIAWSSPARTSNETPSSATTPGNRWVIWSNSSRGGGRVDME